MFRYELPLAITSKFIGVLILLTDTEPSDELRVAARVSALIVLNFFVCMVNGYPCGHREERRGFGDSVNIPMNAEACAVFITQCPQCL